MTLSPAAMNLAAEWLKDCLSNHDSCQRPLETELPTRVIDVGRDGDNPQLFIANGAKGHYVTLSHRWGESTPLTTTMSTLGKRVNGITMAELPRTFQDAVRCTRYLGYKYLWIDSLCIIQDSKVDWEHESSQMQDIYTRAILNISANAAHDSTSGLGSSKRLTAGKPIGGSSNGDYVHLRDLYYHTDSSGVSHVPHQDEGFEHALQTRGWVLQERMLSPRILHFSAYEMAWECDTFCRCECATSPRKPTARPFRTLLVKSEPDYDSHIAWSQLLRKYNTLKLTYESDKLLAFTGLAYKAAEFFRKTYLAGLWKEDLPFALLWYVKGGKESTRLKNYGLSWSWTSIRGEVGPALWPTSPELSVVYEANITAVCLCSEVGRTLGPLQRRSISIRGKKVSINKLFLETQHQRVKISSPPTMLEGELIRPDVSDWTEFLDVGNGPLFLFLLYIYKQPGLNYPLARGLIIRPINMISENSVEEKCYRRIGYYRDWGRRNMWDKYNQFQEEEICLV
ncbi:HET-domain-containing protein [Hyaloscypha variabilis F]|uniref:HET-domain-containing protein n=1 Tax=Hyaloscypha variabilis (strain UAMH 11265 / GT02V1 / F) TaxID=1149755 RepID=A0A2J6RQQ1_HYAVF|nr:HET-domain-containing protein [Hyaloscypha variabilis F]